MWFTRDRTRSQQTRREKDQRRPREAKMKAVKRDRRAASLVLSYMKEPSFGQDHCFSRPGIRSAISSTVMSTIKEKQARIDNPACFLCSNNQRFAYSFQILNVANAQ